MKKLKVILSFAIMMAILAMPMAVQAAELKEASSTNSALYGTITVMETDGWETKSDGSKYITQEYYVTKTNGGYVYIELIEASNVKISTALAGSGFTIVKQTNTNNGVAYLLKANNSVSSKTKILEVVADIVDPTKSECNLSYSPLSTVCAIVGDLYFDDKGSSVTEEKYNEACGNYTPTPDEDLPDTPATGSVVPYIAVGGGLLAIAGVYFFSRKSNKMYKI